MYCRVRPILDAERRKAGPGQDVDVTSFPSEDEIVVKQVRCRCVCAWAVMMSADGGPVTVGVFYAG